MGSTGVLLERAARATPAEIEDRSGGWWVRHTDGPTWWAGATLAHGPADDLVRRVEAIERFYADLASAPRFQICADCPDALDGLLAQRGYRRESPVWLLTRTATTDPGRPAAVASHVQSSISRDWLEVLDATTVPGTDIESMAAGFRSLDLEQAYMTVYIDGGPVGIGRAVVDSGWTGIFNMATAPKARRRGVAGIVLAAIATWANERLAPKLYLQVEESNLNALGLYERAGFAAVTRYHYRVGSS